MAAERIGATIICRDDIPEELCFAIRKSKADTAFVMDYTSKEDEELFRATTPMTRMIKISPYDYADKDAMPEYTEKEIASRYSKNTETTEGNLTWKEFLELGKDYHEDYMAERNPFLCKCGGSGIPDVHLYSTIRCTGKMVASNSATGIDCSYSIYDTVPDVSRIECSTGSVLPSGRH